MAGLPTVVGAVLDSAADGHMRLFRNVREILEMTIRPESTPDRAFTRRSDDGDLTRFATYPGETRLHLSGAPLFYPAPSRH